MGCSLAPGLVALKKSIQRNCKPDYLFVEPSEMVVTKELRDVAAMGRRDTVYDIGPFITLIDGPQFETVWEERRPLIGGQIRDADVVAISRMDRLAPPQVERIRHQLKPYRNAVMLLSSTTGVGVQELVHRIVGTQWASG